MSLAIGGGKVFTIAYLVVVSIAAMLTAAYTLPIPATFQLPVCMTCHGDVVSESLEGDHAVLTSLRGCQYCHGLGPLAVIDMVTGSYRANVDQRLCIGCHEVSLTQGLHGVHSRLALMHGCTRCHNPHSPKDTMGSCSSCHPPELLVRQHGDVHRGINPACLDCHFGGNKPSPPLTGEYHRLPEARNCFRCHDAPLPPVDPFSRPCMDCHQPG